MVGCKWWVETFKNFELKMGTSWQMSLETEIYKIEILHGELTIYDLESRR
jgi:hypothetical protein